MRHRNHLNMAHSNSETWLLLLLVIVMSDMTNGGVQGPIEGYNSLDDMTTTFAPTVAYTHPRWMDPYFDPSTPRNVTALMGKSAYLSCRVRNLGNKTVSWIRHRDIHILTVGSYTYTSDQRFQATHHQDTDDWTLQIKWAQKRDAGMYECQISTQPVRSYFVRLDVVVPTATILGGPDLHVDKGSTINLTCSVKFSPEPPAYIFWYHHEEVINYDSSRGGVSVITEKGDVTTSFLLIQNADLADSGKYSCAPSNADVASVRVHVLNGEHPEAMQTGSSGCQYSWLTIVMLLALVFCYNQQQQQQQCLQHSQQQQQQQHQHKIRRRVHRKPDVDGAARIMSSKSSDAVDILCGCKCYNKHNNNNNNNNSITTAYASNTNTTDIKAAASSAAAGIEVATVTTLTVTAAATAAAVWLSTVEVNICRHQYSAVLNSNSENTNNNNNNKNMENGNSYGSSTSAHTPSACDPDNKLQANTIAAPQTRPKRQRCNR